MNQHPASNLLESLAHPCIHRARRISRLSSCLPGQTLVVADLTGPGQITHIWFTFGGHRERRTETYTRDLVLRIYWDGEDDPSVEAPLFDFFGIGFGRTRYPDSFEVLPFSVQPNGDHSNAPGLNCYFSMPFDSRALITVTNESNTDKIAFYRQVDYQEKRIDTPFRFHARFRRENPAPQRRRNYTLLEAAGRGHYVGCFQYLQVTDPQNAWYHGGGDMLYVDGSSASPSIIHGIGGEDFVGQAWGTEVFAGTYSGCLYQTGRASRQGSEFAFYRFYADNPIVFNECIRVSQQAMANDISSVAYWYQEEPHAHWNVLPTREYRLPGETGPISEIFSASLKQPSPIQWSITDYYECEDEKLDFDVKLPPETGDGNVEWHHAVSCHGFLDFNEYFRRRPDTGFGGWGYAIGVGYAKTRMWSQVDCAATLRIGFNNHLKVWLNGQLVMSPVCRDNFGATNAKVQLRRGNNQLLVKTSNRVGTEYFSHCISLSLADESGNPLQGIEFR